MLAFSEGASGAQARTRSRALRARLYLVIKELAEVSQKIAIRIKMT